MPVHRFSVPGHTTRREFSIYVVVARHRERPEIKLYVGKTGDNRDGCNPVISRAGNHFSHNTIHSQVRNKLGGPTHEFDYEYFYVTFDRYDVQDADRRAKIDVVNEMERRARALVGERVPDDPRVTLLNPYKGTGYVSAEQREARKLIASVDRLGLLHELVAEAVGFVEGLLKEASQPAPDAGKGTNATAESAG